MILLQSFELFNRLITNQNDQQKFHRLDDYSLSYKFSQRFGASSLAIILASTVCHPIDTIKRRLQINATPGYSSISKSTNRPSSLEMAKYIYEKEGLKSFYKGFEMCLAKSIPLALVQFTIFSNMK